MKKNDKNNLEEINPYHVDKLSKVPSWLIVLILKYWAAAAAVFFSAIGGLDIGFDLSEAGNDPISQMAETIKLIIFIGLFLALFMNYIVRPFVRMMNNRRSRTFRFNLINCKGFLSFILSLLYNLSLSIVLCFIIYFLGKHHLIWDPFGTTGGAGIEPFSYALCYVLVDILCILIKNLIIYIVSRVQYKKQMIQEI